MNNYVPYKYFQKVILTLKMFQTQILQIEYFVKLPSSQNQSFEIFFLYLLKNIESDHFRSL